MRISRAKLVFSTGTRALNTPRRGVFETTNVRCVFEDTYCQKLSEIPFPTDCEDDATGLFSNERRSAQWAALYGNRPGSPL